MADHKEFDDFVVAQYGPLLRTAYLLVRDRDLAEDLLQTALTKTWFAGAEAARGRRDGHDGGGRRGCGDGGLVPARLRDPVCCADRPPNVESDPWVLRGRPEADGSVALPAGRYALAADGGGSSRLAVLDVPQGFHGYGGWSLAAEESPTNQHFFGVSYHTVDAVHEDSCTRDEDPIDAGTSPNDLVAALDAQTMTSITMPEPVSLAGHDGVYLELTALDRIRPKMCTGGVFEIWTSGADGHWLLFEPGQVDVITDIVESVRLTDPELNPDEAPGQSPAESEK